MIASTLLLRESAEGVSSYRIFGDEACPQHIAKGSMQSSSKDFKTKKIIVGELPSTLTEGSISMPYDGLAFYIDFALMIVLFVDLDQMMSRVSLQDMGLW